MVIAVSTTESEYIVLSVAMREVIPFLEFMTKDIDALAGGPTRKKSLQIHCLERK